MDGYDNTKDGMITYQDIPNGTLVNNITTINVNVIKVEEKIIEEPENIEEQIEEEKTEEEILNDITNIN